jgi:tetratricopeptide (TPR) repeat protein
LALKLVDRGDYSICKPSVIFYAYQSTLFASVPLQAMVDALYTGCSVAERSGDIMYSILSQGSALNMSYSVGVNLFTMAEKFQDFRQGSTIAWKNFCVAFEVQCNALQHGCNKDSLDSILGLASSTSVMLQLGQLNSKVCAIQRLFLFGRADIITLDVTSISDDMKNGKHNIRPLLLVGIFFDGLIAFQCARRAKDKESQEEWYKRGVTSSTMLLSFSVHSLWNWENKALLLAAEKLYTDGDFDSAASTYDKAICSANEHRFVHEEAIASELAGDFYYERNFHEKSIPFFKHSLKCYMKWGATAVALRLQNDLEVKFGLGEVQNMPTNDLLKAISSLKQQSLSRKRCESIGGD